MSKLSDKQVQDFMEMLYKNGGKDLKKLFKHQKTIQGAILSEIADIMLIYIIENNVMDMSKADQEKEMSKLSNIITTYLKADALLQIKIISDILSTTVTDTFRFYSYNAKLKDVKNIIDANFKGKHFSERVWTNETETAKYLNKQMQEFLKGNVSVNNIKNNIQNTFNTNAYNATRLTNTEVSRCANSAFDRFCIETGVKVVKYNSILDSRLCDDCGQFNGKVYNFNNKIYLPRHPNCRCYYDIVE